MQRDVSPSIGPRRHASLGGPERWACLVHGRLGDPVLQEERPHEGDASGRSLLGVEPVTADDGVGAFVLRGRKGKAGGVWVGVGRVQETRIGARRSELCPLWVRRSPRRRRARAWWTSRRSGTSPACANPHRRRSTAKETSSCRWKLSPDRPHASWREERRTRRVLAVGGEMGAWGRRVFAASARTWVSRRARSTSAGRSRSTSAERIPVSRVRRRMKAKSRAPTQVRRSLGQGRHLGREAHNPPSPRHRFPPELAGNPSRSPR